MLLGLRLACHAGSSPGAAAITDQLWGARHQCASAELSEQVGRPQPPWGQPTGNAHKQRIAAVPTPSRRMFPLRAPGGLQSQSGGSVMTKVETYRRRARMYLDQARRAPSGERRTHLLELAQLWHHLAQEQEATKKPVEGTPPSVVSQPAHRPAQQQQQIQPKDDDTKKE
jgi:hypothetical protein